MPQIRFWLLVLVVTCMIWIAADQRVTTTEDFSMPLIIKPESPRDLLVEILDSEIPSINITFQGPNRSITQMETQKDTQVVVIEIGNRATGSYQINFLDELRNQMDQFPSGLSIVEVFPPGVKIEVDKYVQQQVGIDVDMEDLEFEDQPVVNPRSVTVTVPEKKFKKLSEAQRVIVVPIASAFKGVLEGEFSEKQVAVPKKIAGLAVTQVDPPQVTLSGTLKVRTREGRISTVPINLLVSNDVVERFHISLDGRDDNIVTREVAIRGPTEIVAELEAKSTKYSVEGYVKITLEDTRREPSTPFLKVPIILNLPPGVEIVREPDPVEVQILSRS